ncbi:hypothetical protein F441_14644 [Phytophthora nicotianae CJ01A1]|uniref:Uncharacterized protein n=3 Tax=Phytophthora nicotianae TaxID=4792 RepID=W2YRF8_PHYNI|nr:hypothetical protein L915_14378 [Phytophthora nicotianae]ETL33203.1 hypothetical protein L916_14287 [Phytophthora nicotianae]ETP09491.1 hypothetical protein F441_14644 [Phytophthora nicotianae CJ01A1]ETP37541.1 hypothetical protein F442_14642 [Phytophthora nicotianae P10297]
MPTPKRSRLEDNTEDTMMIPSEIDALDLSSVRVLIKVLQQTLKKTEDMADKAWERANMEKKGALVRADAIVKRVEEEKQQELEKADTEKKEVLARAVASRKEVVGERKSFARSLHDDTRILTRNQDKMLNIIGTGARYFAQLENHVPTLQQTTALLKEHAEEMEETGFMVSRKNNLDALLSSFGPNVMRQAEPFCVTKDPDAEINAVVEVGKALTSHEKAKRSVEIRHHQPSSKRQKSKPRYPNLTLTVKSFVWTDRMNGMISLEHFYDLLAILSRPHGEDNTLGCVEDLSSDICARLEDVSLDIVV